MAVMFDTWHVIHWILLALLVVLYVLSCIRVASRMGAIGKNPALWFLITLFLTFLPALIVLRRRSAAATATGMFSEAERCRHCSEVLTGSDAYADRCPACKMPLHDGDAA